MNRMKAVITAEIVEPYLSRIRAACDVELAGWALKQGVVLGEDEAIGAFRDAEILIVGYEQLPRRVLDACAKLRLIACPRGNPVNVDLAAARERNIPVLYTPGRNANAVAEHMLGLTISLVRHIARANHEIKNGKWLYPPVDDIYQVPPKDDIVWGFVYKDPSPYVDYYGYELYGKVFGMIGFGAVGRRAARFFQALDMRVVVADPYIAPELAAEAGIELMPMDELLKTADFVSVQCKVTPETKGLIGAREIALMKPTACFINTARGVIVDQRALVEALQERRIAGAALDVFWQEPMPENHPFLTMDNVVITPHIGSASADVPVHHSDMIVTDVLAYLEGRPMKYEFR